MTAIPATLAAAGQADAVEITLAGLRQHSLTETETRDDILLLFDIDLTVEQARRMSGYLSRLLSTVRAGDMSAGDAARDIRQVMSTFMPDGPVQYEMNLI
ncbi:hypothetical protein [Asticcacaulis taihuensis]|uniref:hypothetical protein n=1 Tax=Asticcacaulis taihuensis TaxID=260084 RepID=UPI0026F1D127|nr:hypothetical protein [Asticcacaulis taihuensis]